MNINRHNYESFFLLYADHELQPAEQKAVEEFVRQNPDLEKELALLQQSVFRPESEVVFAGKEDLMRSENPLTGIHTGNYESFFLLYADNELSADEKKTVEAFLDLHPQYQGELELLHAARMTPDRAVLYEGKQALYRREEKDKVVPFAWWRLAAAAIVVVLLGFWWMNRLPKATPPVSVASGTQQKPAIQPVPAPATAPKTTANPVNAAPLTAQATNKKDKKKATEQPENSGLVKTRHNSKEQRLTQPSNHLPEPYTAPDEAPLVAENTARPSRITEQPRRTIDINGVRTPGKAGLTGQLVNIDRPDQDLARFAVNTDNSNNDQIDVLNTSVNKTALRGILRKASRIIAKKTSTGDDDDNSDHRKHILIGSFAIAVK